jgi:hypothetical protein
MKLHHLIHFSIALAVCIVASLVGPTAYAQTSSETAVATATMRGRVTDPTGALIAGTKISIVTSKGVKVTHAVADASGSYTISGLAPGSYIVQAVYEGFATFSSSPIELAAGQVKRVDIALAIEMEQQSVTVSDETPTVSTESSSNASSVVLTNKDLDSLSDDPDELANQLSALAGPSAGPNGGQIYIDGFTAGELPAKSSIREIRINSNPFSAEYDRLGFGRIEILTKPGTDKLHGRINAQGNDSSFNTGNPFTKDIPPYHSYQIGGYLGGSLGKKASFSVNIEQRNTQNANVYSMVDDAPVEASDGTWSIGSLSGSLVSPETHTNFSPRIDLQLGSKHTLTARYQFFRMNTSNSLNGSTSLPSLANSSTTTENSIQLSDSWVLSSHVVNETRFQYNRRTSTNTPSSSDPSIGAPGFQGGGSGGASSDHTDSLEFYNLTTLTKGAHTVKFGLRLRDNRDANATDGGFNGSFQFNTVQDLANAYMIEGDKLSVSDCLASYPVTTSDQTPCGPYKFNYTTGTAGIVGNVFDAAVFLQDDWKYNRFLTVSAGLRWEGQNHVADHSNFGPRLAVAYALDGHKNAKQAKTVLRGGIGFFYDRFGIGSELNLLRFSGSANGQQQYTFTNPNPSCFNSTSITGLQQNLTELCGTATANANTIQKVDPNYQSPTTIQESASVERQLTKNMTLTATYSHSFGEHQIATIDANPYKPGTYVYGSSTLTGIRLDQTVATDPTKGIINMTYPEAAFKQDQLTMNVNARINSKFTIVGFYNLTFSNANTGMASDSYNLSADWGRSNFASRNMAMLMGNFTLPWNISMSPMIMVQTGRPYNITVPYDLTGDNFMNNRPAIASSDLCAASTGRYVQTKYGCFDVTPDPGTKVIPVNMLTGPGSRNINLRIARAFAVGPKLVSAASQDQNNPQGGPGGQGGGPMAGGGGGGRPGGGGGGMGGPGGGMGGGMGGPGGGMGGSSSSSSARKYSLTFSAQASNVLNIINLSNPNGTLTPTCNTDTSGNVIAGTCGPGSQFGQSSSLAGGFGAAGSAARRIFVQMSFSF